MLELKRKLLTNKPLTKQLYITLKQKSRKDLKMKKLRLGLVGCGKMMGRHVEGVHLVNNVEIVSLCDVIRENAEDVAKVLGNNPSIHTDWRDMVDEVDAVMIALPHDLHFECGMFFALNNKHILMEKPLCNTEEECVKLIETCEEHNVKLMCAYPVRYWKGIRKLKELIDSGDYGKVMQMSVWTEQLTGSSSEFGFADRSNRSWHTTARLGGGQLFSHGCHYIDIMLWFLGEPLYGSHVGTNVGTPWMLREGTSAVTIKFKNGAIGYHGATWGARGTRLAYDFQIHTEKGLIDYEHRSGEIRFYNAIAEHVPGEEDSPQKSTLIWKNDDALGKQTQYEIQHFTECVLEDKKPLTDGRSALQGLRVIWALYNAENNHTLANLEGLGLGE